MSKDNGLQLQSRVDADGTVTLSVREVPTPQPRADDVVVRVEAAPINPSDLGLLFGGAEADAFQAQGDTLVAKLSPEILRAMTTRVGKSFPVGNEGAGVVVAAGANAQALLGKTVGIRGGGSYAEYRSLPASEVAVFPEGTSAEDGAAWFVNPATVLGFLETTRSEGHRGVVHTAAASNLGQMLIRAAAKDGVPLVNIVRRPEQVAQLRALGAQHVVDSSTPTFVPDLIEAIAATEATVAFDAIGGGKIASQILTAMEVVASRSLSAYSRYGSSVHKQIYIYGALDRGPSSLNRPGFTWSVSGWLLPNFLAKAGPDVERKLRERIVSELKTTFASQYTRRISLREALSVETLRDYARMATGTKYLITPHAR